MLCPWNGGASNLRRARCSLPSSAKTEPGPKIRLRLGWTLIRSSVLARNTCRASAGSETTTLRPKNGTLMTKTEPCRFAALRRNRRRKPAKRTIWTGFGRRTAGGWRARTRRGFGVDGRYVGHVVSSASGVSRRCTTMLAAVLRRVRHAPGVHLLAGRGGACRWRSAAIPFAVRRPSRRWRTPRRRSGGCRRRTE